MENMMKEKNSKICQLNLKIQDLKTKLSNCIIIYNDIESHLKKEIDSLKVEISEKSANFEMEKTGLETKFKEVEYNLKKDAEEAKENCTKLEQDLLRKTESFDQLIWSWAELEKFHRRRKKSIQKWWTIWNGQKGQGFVYLLCET